MLVKIKQISEIILNTLFSLFAECGIGLIYFLVPWLLFICPNHGIVELTLPIRIVIFILFNIVVFWTGYYQYKEDKLNELRCKYWRDENE